MATQVSFKEEIRNLEQILAAERRELEQLRARLSENDLETARIRAALDDLKRTLYAQRAEDTGPLQVNPDTGRPHRGARREQVEAACKRLGHGGRDFRTAAVLSLLEKLEGELSTGVRSYVYATMNTLEEEGVVTKVGRGRWELRG